MAHLPLLSIDTLLSNPGIDGNIKSTIEQTIGGKAMLDFFDRDLFGAGGSWLGTGGSTATERA